MFTLETVACLGACGLAPVMTVDGEVHAKMSPHQRPGVAGEDPEGGGRPMKLTRGAFCDLRNEAQRPCAAARRPLPC